MTPPNEHTSEGGRDDRGVPYHAESTRSTRRTVTTSAPRPTAPARWGPIRWLISASLTGDSNGEPQAASVGVGAIASSACIASAAGAANFRCRRPQCGARLGTGCTEAHRGRLEWIHVREGHQAEDPTRCCDRAQHAGPRRSGLGLHDQCAREHRRGSSALAEFQHTAKFNSSLASSARSPLTTSRAP